MAATRRYAGARLSWGALSQHPESHAHSNKPFIRAGKLIASLPEQREVSRLANTVASFRDVSNSTPGMARSGCATAIRSGSSSRSIFCGQQILAEEIADALRVAVRGVKETQPARVGPAPHSAGADALGDSGVQDRDAGRVGAQIARGEGASG